MSCDVINVESDKFVEAMLKKVQNQCVYFFSQKAGALPESQKKLLNCILQRFYCCVQKRIRASIAISQISSAGIVDAELGESLQELILKREEALFLNEQILKKRTPNSVNLIVSENETDYFSKIEEELSNVFDFSRFERSEFQENLLGDLMTMISSLKSSLETTEDVLLSKEKDSISNLQVFANQISSMGPQSSAIETTLSELQGMM